MITIASEDHRLHAPKGELAFGEFVPPYENPRRMDSILARIAETRLGTVLAPERFGPELIRRSMEVSGEILNGLDVSRYGSL